MTIFYKASLLIVLFMVGIYSSVPSPSFPKPPPDSVQSLEEADLETPLRRTYFTNFSRSKLLTHFQKELSVGLPFLTLSYVIYYPPEDAQTLIRDQTRSVHLPEIIHPFRESLFINIFESQTAKDEIWYKGVHYKERVTLRYVPTKTLPRLLIILPAFLFLLYLLAEVSKDTIKTTKSIFKK